MEKFKFRLEKIKQFREEESRDSKRELGRQTTKLTHAENILTQLIDERQRQKIATDGILTGAELGLLSSYEYFLQELLVAQRQAVQEAEIAVEKAREHLLEKAKAEKALSLLKERKQEEFMEEKKRIERKSASSNALQQHLRRELENKE